MKQVVRRTGKSAVPTPGMAPTLYRPPSPDRDDRSIYLTVHETGRYRLQIWTAQEFAALPADDRPRSPRRKGDSWYTLEAVPPVA